MLIEDQNYSFANNTISANIIFNIAYQEYLLSFQTFMFIAKILNIVKYSNIIMWNYVSKPFTTSSKNHFSKFSSLY